MLGQLLARDPFDDWSPGGKLIGCLALLAIFAVVIYAAMTDEKDGKD